MRVLRTPSESKDLPIVMRLGVTTWRVLLALLGARRPLGPRSLARMLDLSSHSVALYHLEKLIDEGLVEKTSDGDYRVRPDAQLDFLDEFLYVGYHVVPRVVLYASFVTGLVLAFVVLGLADFSAQTMFVFLIGISASVFLWSEVYRQWRRLP